MNNQGIPESVWFFIVLAAELTQDSSQIRDWTQVPWSGSTEPSYSWVNTIESRFSGIVWAFLCINLDASLKSKKIFLLTLLKFKVFPNLLEIVYIKQNFLNLSYFLMLKMKLQDFRIKFIKITNEIKNSIQKESPYRYTTQKYSLNKMDNLHKLIHSNLGCKID